jgi:hypothetical protein
MNSFIEAICIFYTYEKTCILVGAVNEDRNIVLKKEIYLQKVSVEYIRDLLVDGTENIIDELLIKNNDIPSIWTNKNKFLAAVLEGYLTGQIDFENEHKSDYKSIDDLYLSLIESNRIFKSDGVTMQIPHSEDCLKMLLWAIGEETVLEKADTFEFMVSSERNIYDIFRYW